MTISSISKNFAQAPNMFLDTQKSGNPQSTGPHAGNASSPISADTSSSGSGSSEDPTTQTLKQLERQLSQVEAEISKEEAANVPDEEKAGIVQGLSAQAAALEAQINTLLEQQAQGATGSNVDTTA